VAQIDVLAVGRSGGLAIAGGVLTIAGTFAPWYGTTVSGWRGYPFDVTVNGYAHAGYLGWLLLLVGIAGAALGGVRAFPEIRPPAQLEGARPFVVLGAAATVIAFARLVLVPAGLGARWGLVVCLCGGILMLVAGVDGRTKHVEDRDRA
jgi:hypothetical protein